MANLSTSRKVQHNPGCSAPSDSSIPQSVPTIALDAVRAGADGHEGANDRNVPRGEMWAGLEEPRPSAPRRGQFGS
jgi:hypothetical protein